MENKQLNLILTVVKVAIAVIGVILSLMAMTGGDVNGALYITYAGIIIALLFVVVFALKSFVESIKTNKATLIGVGAFALVCIIAYATAGSEIPASLADVESATETTMKWSGAGISLLYILLGGTIVSVIVAEASKLIK